MTIIMHLQVWIQITYKESYTILKETYDQHFDRNHAKQKPKFMLLVTKMVLVALI